MANRILSAVAIVLTLPAAANAQDASQWVGIYGGLSYTTGGAYQVYDPAPDYDLEGSGLGVMVGYNYATGPWVLGGELAYSAAEIGEVPPGSPDYTFTAFVDIKARAGYAMTNVLFYGTVGATFTQWQEGPGSGGNDGDGFLYGVGIDYLISPRFFVGAEYLARDVTSDWNNDPADSFDADVDTITLRAGLKF